MRIWIGLLGSIACALMHSHSSSLSVAIVRMARYDTSNAVHNNTGQCIVTSNDHGNQTEEAVVTGEFEWSESLQGLILGANFYMQLITPTISGRVTERFGAKWWTLTAIALSGLITAIIPILARYNVNLLIGLLVIQGLFHGCLFSALFSLYANWFTAPERSIAIAAIAAFANFGSAITTPVAGYLCEHGFAGGWPSVFYVVGIAHVPWIVLWIILVEDSPLKSHLSGLVKCSEKELEYLKVNSNSYGVPEKAVKAPWLKIITSKCVWGTIINKTSATWLYYLLLAKLPSYLDKVFAVTVIQNGLFNAGTSLATGICMIICGPLSGYIIKKTEGRVSRTAVRKTFQTIALLGPALCLAVITGMGCNSTAVVALMITGLFLYGFMSGGEFAVISEFAPDFSGTVFGIAATLCVWPSFVAPYVVGLMLDQNPGDRTVWNEVFYITIAICIVGTVAFIFMGSAEPQSWGTIKKIDHDQYEDIDDREDNNTQHCK